MNPTIGRLSDSIGRKKFMMLSPYAAVILKTWVLLRPSLLSLTTERIVCDGLRTLCGTTMGQTCITDLVDPKEIGNEISSLYVVFERDTLISHHLNHSNTRVSIMPLT